jgi:hypothetical protein
MHHRRDLDGAVVIAGLQLIIQAGVCMMLATFIFCLVSAIAQ